MKHNEKIYRGKLQPEGADIRGFMRYYCPVIPVGISKALVTPSPESLKLIPGLAMIDTGSQLSAVVRESVSVLGLEIEDSVDSVGVSGVQRQDVCRFSFRLPNDECRFALLGTVWDGLVPPFVVMILGMDVLRWCHLEINGKEATFALRWTCLNDHEHV